VAQRGFAASFRRSAFSGQLLHQPGDHPFDFGGFLRVAILTSFRTALQQIDNLQRKAA
jgi:hypothetical protein